LWMALSAEANAVGGNKKERKIEARRNQMVHERRRSRALLPFNETLADGIPNAQEHAELRPRPLVPRIRFLTADRIIEAVLFAIVLGDQFRTAGIPASHSGAVHTNSTPRSS
jgi:hypothetical protein